MNRVTSYPFNKGSPLQIKQIIFRHLTNSRKIHLSWRQTFEYERPEQLLSVCIYFLYYKWKTPTLPRTWLKQFVVSYVRIVYLLLLLSLRNQIVFGSDVTAICQFFSTNVLSEMHCNQQLRQNKTKYIKQFFIPVGVINTPDPVRGGVAYWCHKTPCSDGAWQKGAITPHETELRFTYLYQNKC